MKRESGHMTAIAIIMTLILASVLVYNVKLLSSERSFLYEREAMFRAETYMQMGRNDLLDKIRIDGMHEGETGIFNYPEGNITYKTIKLTEDVFVFQMEVTLNKSGRATAFLYYNDVKNEVVKWVVV
jgi:hypothetical protein